MTFFFPPLPYPQHLDGILTGLTLYRLPSLLVRDKATVENQRGQFEKTVPLLAGSKTSLLFTALITTDLVVEGSMSLVSSLGSHDRIDLFFFFPVFEQESAAFVLGVNT